MIRKDLLSKSIRCAIAAALIVNGVRASSAIDHSASAVLTETTAAGATSTLTLPTTWRLATSTLANVKQGAVVLEILEKPPALRERSCLGVEKATQHQVNVRSKSEALARIRLGETAVAVLTDDHVTIDFTAGFCDAYYLFVGKLTRGGARGDVIMMDLGGSRTVGHFAEEFHSTPIR